MPDPRTDPPFLIFDTLEQFEALIEASRAGPVVIFKHSPTCGTSAQAFDELRELVQADPPLRIHLIDVRSSRSLCQAIALRLGVRHESPQVLVVKDGAVIWHASHWRVTAADVQRAVEAMATA